MSQPLVGAPRSRVDGPDKVQGRAVYAGDNALEGMVHAVVVPSTIARGTIRSIDDSRARAAAGVIEVMTYRNAPHAVAKKQNAMDSNLFLLQDREIEFDRQPVAVVIAETFEQAVHAADLVTVEYDTQTPQIHLDSAPSYMPKEIFGRPATHQRGTPEAAFASSPVRISQTYRTPTEHHNPMETHGTVAAWDGDNLTLHDSTQWAFGVQKRLSEILGIDPKQIHVIAPYVGGAFGGKGQAWSHVPLTAMAAKLVKRPVKLLVTRPQMFGWVGHRPQTEQHISIGAKHDGTLVSVKHDVVSDTSVSDEFVEPCAVFSRDLYAVPNYAMSQQLRRLNISKPTYQRAPGESTGGYAFESAMDELAHALHMDPLELRLRNYSEKNPDTGKPYTEKSLRECYARASEAFGWKRRNPQPRSMRDGRLLVGWGMATASRSTHRGEATVRMRMDPSGSVVVQCGTIEQGTGSPTVYAQLAAEILELPYDKVRFEWGDTTLPQAPLAAGSQTASSIGSAVVVAAGQLRERLAAAGGHVPSGGIDLTVNEKPGDDEERFAQQAFGAHFAEVTVDPDLGTVAVRRFVGAYNAGRILNEKTAKSQFLGGIVWGISMALFEKTRFDMRTARIMNATLSHYLVPTNADIPDPEIIIVAADDPRVNPAQVRGIGEVSMTGCAAAIANAVFHATGIRVRDLPITPDTLLA